MRAIAMAGKKKFELLEHTADSGIVAYGDSLKELLENAALGMFSILADVEKVKPKLSVAVEVNASDYETLLVALLRELLFKHDAQGIVFGNLEIEALGESTDEHGLKNVWLKAKAFGEPIHETEAELHGYIKAVTYHGLQVEKREEGWRAQVVFDV
jgi:SHS2 domain-containing protein